MRTGGGGWVASAAKRRWISWTVRADRSRGPGNGRCATRRAGRDRSSRQRMAPQAATGTVAAHPTARMITTHVGSAPGGNRPPLLPHVSVGSVTGPVAIGGQCGERIDDGALHRGRAGQGGVALGGVHPPWGVGLAQLDRGQGL